MIRIDSTDRELNRLIAEGKLTPGSMISLLPGEQIEYAIAKQAGPAKITYYWTPEIREQPPALTGGFGRVEVKRLDGSTMFLRVASEDKKPLRMEGTARVRLLSGKLMVISFWKPGLYVENSGWQAPWGLGSRHNPLTPLACVAAEKEFAYGDRIELTCEHNGTRFRQIAYVSDVGAAITGERDGIGRFDWFVGDDAGYRDRIGVEPFKSGKWSYSVTRRRVDIAFGPKAMQRILADGGYYTAAIDGIPGKLTKTALEQFQKMIDPHGQEIPRFEIGYVSDSTRLPGPATLHLMSRLVTA